MSWLRLLFLLGAVGTLGCSGSGGGGRGSTSGTTGGASLREPWPRIPDQGGPVLAHLQLVTVTFNGDPNQGTLESFGDWIVASAWLTTAGTDYGIGTGAHLQKVRIPTALPAILDSTALEQAFIGYLDGGTLPPPAANVMYVLYLPSSTTITDPALGTSCQDFDGYHAEVQVGPAAMTDVAYAVIASCPSQSGALAIEEQTASHEIIETATDPFPDDQPAWEITDMSSPFAAVGGEVADMCLGTIATESTWSVQRVYSNTAAARGDSPCVPPSSAANYLGFSVSPATVQTAAIGSTVTYTLSAWGTNPSVLGNVTLEVYSGFETSPAVGLTQLFAGQQTTLQLSIPATATSGEMALLAVHADTGADTNDWPIELIAR